MHSGHSLSINARFSGKKRKKAIVITSKDGTRIFFSHYNLFFFKEKLARKARVHMHSDASISDRAHAPWASHNTP